MDKLDSVILTNVGNVKENVDLEIVSVAGGSSTNLVNLDSGRKYAAAFNDNLFLIDVQEAVRSDVRAEERGRFSITVLGADYRLVY